jgi:hypothetical protein
MRIMALDRAQKVIAHYADLVGVEDEEDVIVDMLADLIQWCAYREVDFDRDLQMAHTHADAEMNGED